MSLTRLTLLGSAAVAALASLPTVAIAQDITPRVSAAPAKHAGACPATITFNGQLRATGAGPVSYQWIRSDGGKSKAETVMLGDIGSQGFSSKDVSTTWKLGGPGDPPINGWVKLRAISPKALESAAANFTVTCPGAPVEVKAQAVASPSGYKGVCPTIFTFKGQIFSSKAGPVQYVWERSDGAKSPPQVVNFPGPGSKTVQSMWKLGGPGMKYSGWERLHVLAPKNVVSNQAAFSLECAAPGPAVVVKAQAVAVPSIFKGACPATITFKGQIFSSKAGPVQYTWMRSDGAKGPTQVLNFPGPGAQNVQTTWQLGGKALPKYSGWQKLHVTSPANVFSKQANFQVSCSP